MVSKTNRGRRTSLKRRYTKRKVHRNKYARKSYRTKRGGAWGRYNDCTNSCNQIGDPEKKTTCMKGCERAFPNNKDGNELPNNYPDLRNYTN